MSGENVTNFLAHYGIEAEKTSLAHYGVPGMKWGKRKGRVKKAPLSPEASYRRTRRIQGAIAGGALLAIYGPHVADLSVRALGSAALAAKAARGARAAATVLNAVGASPTASLAKGADGVWRLMGA